MSLTDDLEGVRESALEIMGETDRMDRWAREFLQFSVINTNSPEYLDLNDLVRTVLKEHETVLDRMAISVQLDMVAAQLPVNANASPLSQVLGNLIMNAVEAMGENGELKISTSLDSHCNHAVVSITDNGPGLLEEIKDKLFQPFATTKPTGTGLGLALSMHLVEHYSGILEILNEPGRGVTATVRLPLLGGPL
jgi:signal transduction histidine kinase